MRDDKRFFRVRQQMYALRINQEDIAGATKEARLMSDMVQAYDRMVERVKSGEKIKDVCKEFHVSTSGFLRWRNKQIGR